MMQLFFVRLLSGFCFKSFSVCYFIIVSYLRSFDKKETSLKYGELYTHTQKFVFGIAYISSQMEGEYYLERIKVINLERKNANNCIS